MLEFNPRNVEWMEFGACRTVGDPDTWFPDRGGNTIMAKRVCSLCPVRVECLTWGVYTGEVHGVWGGKSGSELEEIRDRLGLDI